MDVGTLWRTMAWRMRESVSSHVEAGDACGQAGRAVEGVGVDSWILWAGIERNGTPRIAPRCGRGMGSAGGTEGAV